jgi:hypothetical protein
MNVTYQTVTGGDYYSNQITSPQAIVVVAEGLPAGLSMSEYGEISGYLQQIGRFAISILCRGAGGTGVAVLDLTVVQPEPPVITSPDTVTTEAGTSFSYQITALSKTNILSYGATNLPIGLTINTSTGLITGTPTTVSEDPVVYSTAVLSCTNAAGTRNQDLIFSLQQRPVITSSLTPLIFEVGQPITPYIITATKTASSFNASSLPPGLSIDVETGVISGTPSTPGPFTIGLSASNTVLTGTANLPVTVNKLAEVTSGSAGGRQLTAFSYQITATGYPAITSYGASGLPSGLTVNTSTGLVSGTPSVFGNFTVILSATNPGGTGTKSVTFSIAEALALVGQIVQVYPVLDTSYLPTPQEFIFADKTNNAIRCYFGKTGRITTLATGITSPYGVVKTSAGIIYASSDTTGTVYKLVGTSWVAVATGLTNPRGMCADRNNNVYVAAGTLIKKITSSGTVTTFASGMVNLTSVSLIYWTGVLDHFMASGGNAPTGGEWQITTAGAVTPRNLTGVQTSVGALPMGRWTTSPLQFYYAATEGGNGPYSTFSQYSSTGYGNTYCGTGPLSAGPVDWTVIYPGLEYPVLGPSGTNRGISNRGKPIFQTLANGFRDGPVV